MSQFLAFSHIILLSCWHTHCACTICSAVLVNCTKAFRVWHTHCACAICSAVLVNCTPASLHLYCRTWRQTDLRRGFESKFNQTNESLAIQPLLTAFGISFEYPRGIIQFIGYKFPRMLMGGPRSRVSALVPPLTWAVNSSGGKVKIQKGRVEWKKLELDL